MVELDYGPVLVSSGRHKGRILYYDDDETDRTVICYSGHPTLFPRRYLIQLRALRDPTIDDLLQRREAIWRELSAAAIAGAWDIETATLHDLWAEKSLIDDTLHDRSMFGALGQLDSSREVFLCHSSSDKGMVRMVNDDLMKRGVNCWLDENKIRVGDSIVSKISDGLDACPVMIAFLSPASVRSIWARKEWHSFLARQLSGTSLRILPALLETCDIPAILADVKYADFTVDYHDGFIQVFNALK
jgi:hypothetical protein